MNDILEARLRTLGDDLALDESDGLVDTVLARLDECADPVTESRRHRATLGWLRVAAVGLVVVAAALLVLPSSREAIADWFGLGGVDIDRDPDLSVPDHPPAVDDAATAGPGTLVDVDGTDVVVAEIDVGEFGGLDDAAFLSKTLASGTAIERVDVAGDPGLWIAGEPHVVTYLDRDGRPVTERFAGNTLLWQDGDVIRRVEGFASLAAALAFAAP